MREYSRTKEVMHKRLISYRTRRAANTSTKPHAQQCAETQTVKKNNSFPLQCGVHQNETFLCLRYLWPHVTILVLPQKKFFMFILVD